MPEYIQNNRPLIIYTALGRDELLLAGFAGRESVSDLFSFNLRMYSENSDLRFEDIIGKNATIHLALPNGKTRFINGIISSFAQGEAFRLEGGAKPLEYTKYYAILVPRLWMLTQTNNCRIFQKKTVPEIIKEIFIAHDLADYVIRTYGKYEEREYCVQYRESDFDFISRLMEEEGIFYYFEHEDGKHRLMIADNNAEFKFSQFHPSISYKSLIGEEELEDVIYSWNKSQSFRADKYILSDFDFKQASTDLRADIKNNRNNLEVYDYPGEYNNKTRGGELVRVRMEEGQRKSVVIEGGSGCRGFVPGYRFDLKNHYRRDFNGSYILTSVYHRADHDLAYRSGYGGDGFSYENSFECVPNDVRFRPERRTPRPVVRGSQTAIVVGPANEEIFVDNYGRVKVKFHWDREDVKPENRSCWIRVSQNWAGKRWGAVFLPRIGQEVIVDFLEGKPDKPIITGRVYNGENMPPYALPDEKTKSVIKSSSSVGGGGFNEIGFEDKKGGEELFINAERDMNVRVKNNSSENISGNSQIKINGNLSESVSGKISIDAQGNISINSADNITINASDNITLKVGGSTITINGAGISVNGGVLNANRRWDD